MQHRLFRSTVAIMLSTAAFMPISARAQGGGDLGMVCPLKSGPP